MYAIEVDAEDEHAFGTRDWRFKVLVNATVPDLSL
jgi:hypothetical protein